MLKHVHSSSVLHSPSHPSCRDHEVSEGVYMGLGEIAKVGRRSFQCHNMFTCWYCFSMVNQRGNAPNILYCFWYLRNKMHIVQFQLPKNKSIIFFTFVHLKIFFKSHLPPLELTQKGGLKDCSIFLPLYASRLNSFCSIYLKFSPFIFHLPNLFSSSRLSSNVPPLGR